MRDATRSGALAALSFLLLFLGVVVPTVLYVVWGVMEIVSLPIAK